MTATSHVRRIKQCVSRTGKAGMVLMLTALLWGPPAAAAADVVLDWNAIMVTTVSGQNPFAQSRLAAITHLAMFEAVNAITRDYRSYTGTIVAPPFASPQAAVVAAAHGVLRHYVPSASTSLDAAKATSLATIPNGPWKARGIAVGEAAAAAMIARRADDGSAPPAFHVPGSSEPGEWQMTLGCPAAGGILLQWGQVTPFGLEDVSQFPSDPPPALSSHIYARDYNEVKEVGAANSFTRPTGRATVARFYAAVLAVATWNPVVRQVASSRRLSLTDSARLFALLNMAMADALVAVMETKYRYTFWRPETAIHGGDADSNAHTEADASFAPFVAAPCFPGYGSAHAAASHAGRRVAEAFFGEEVGLIVLSNPAVPNVVLHYRSFEEIADDIDDARVYGGIHFRFDQRAGASQGRRIGEWIVKHSLRPTRGWWQWD
jgi:hypothetical protein